MRTLSTGTVSKWELEDWICWISPSLTGLNPESPVFCRPEPLICPAFEPMPGRLTTCAMTGAASINEVRLPLALSCAYSSIASPEYTMSTIAQPAQYSRTAMVDRIATITSTSTPTYPLRISSIMPLSESNAV